MDAKERVHVVTGGVIPIVLGILIFLNSMNIYVITESWPILLIVISIYTLVQRARDVGGWFIGVVGIIFLVVKNFYAGLDRIAAYALPSLLVLLGIYILFTYFKKRQS